MTAKASRIARSAFASWSLVLLLTLAVCGRASSADAAGDGSTTTEPGKAPVAAAPAENPVSGLATPTVRILEIAGDMTLDAAERTQLAELEARERLHDAAASTKANAELEATLAKYDAANAVQKAKMRHDLRVALYYGRTKMTDPLPSHLLEAHDPVLVEDKARHEVVTWADLRALDASNRYVAEIAGTSVPPLAEKPGERAELNRRYSAEEQLRTTLLYAGPRHAMMVAAIDGLPAAKRAEIDNVIRQEVHTPDDAVNAARGMENAVVQASQRQALSARDRVALADFNRWMQRSNQLTVGMARLSSAMRVLNTQNLVAPN